MKSMKIMILLFAVAASAQSAPPAAAPRVEVRQQMKLLADKEKADIQALDDKIRTARDAASGKIKTLEDQIKGAREQEHTAVAALEDQKKITRAGYETQRDALMEPIEPGYTARRQALIAKLLALDDQQAADIKALDAQEKQDIEALRAKDQDKRKAIRDGYAQKKRQAEQDARAKK